MTLIKLLIKLCPSARTLPPFLCQCSALRVFIAKATQIRKKSKVTTGPVKCIGCHKLASFILKSADDVCISNRDEAMCILSENWVQHFQKLHPNIKDLNLEQKRLEQKFKNEETEMMAKFKFSDHPFTGKEMNEVLEKLKNNK